MEIEQVQDISGLTESDFKGLEMSQIDQVLQSAFVNYLGLEKKERKRQLYSKAKELFPNLKITFNISDAL